MTSAVWEELRNILSETAELLNRENSFDPAAVAERTRQLAQPTAYQQTDQYNNRITPTSVQHGDRQMAQVLIFTLGNERYAWPVASVSAISRVERITPVPFAPAYYAGVISVRGQILSVMDLRAYFNLPPLSMSPEFVMVIDGAGLQIGVLASAVYDVMAISTGTLTHNTGLDPELVMGVFPDGLTLLDAETLLRRERRRIEDSAR